MEPLFVRFIPPMRALIVGALVAVLVGVCASGASRAQTRQIEETYRDFKLVGVVHPPDATFDIPHVTAEDAFILIKQAIDALYASSPFSKAEIAKLKKAGRVVIGYDPAFPKREMTKITAAVFLPDFYKEGGIGKDFVAVVSRYGAKWPARELAAVIAHELVGHGIQHLRGRLENVRNVDLECEAYLYEEKAFQDLGTAKHTAEMIQFRKALENHWCRDFRAWTRKHEPKKMALWDRLDPDVPEILKVYLRYIDALRKSGVAGKAVKAAKVAQERASQEKISGLAASNEPNDHFHLGMIHLRGLGPPENPKLAATWFEKAAIKGHPAAQDALATLYYRGLGVKKNYAQAARWYRPAAERGITNSQVVLGALLVKGRGVKKDLDEALAWFQKAADAGHEKAKKAVPAVQKMIAKRDGKNTG